jgi:hypothetical protein
MEKFKFYNLEQNFFKVSISIQKHRIQNYYLEIYSYERVDEQSTALYFRGAYPVLLRLTKLEILITTAGLKLLCIEILLYIRNKYYL